MDYTILEKLDEHDWKPTIIRLSAYVVSLCNYHRWRLPDAYEPEDVVIEAIHRVYEGMRVWDPAKDPDIGRFMASVVKSLLNNMMRRKKLEMSSIGEYEVEEIENSTDDLYYRELNQSILQSVKSDAEMAIVYKCLRDGLTPQQIAEEYQLDIKIIRNAQKRLRRVVMRIVEDL